MTPGASAAIPPDAAEQIVKKLGSRRWRLSNLYYILDKDGREVLFRPNWAQEQFLDEMHYLNLCLKARQLGFSTLFSIYMLDACLFSRDTSCGLIDVTIDDAKLKLRKIRYAYDRLPDWLKRYKRVAMANAFMIEWTNGSSIRVGTSHRGGTLNFLHVSELGKIAARHPVKAQEIKSGAFNTLQAGQVCWVESTAEGQEGLFYDMCSTSEAKARRGDKLTELDFKFHFYPWWRAHEYRLDPTGVLIPDEFQRYFAELDGLGIKLDAAQKAWYVKKAEQQTEDIKREFPSTSKEAFEASIEGAYYGPLIEKLEAQGKIGSFKAEPSMPVHTAWDIGHSDYTSIWFWQRIYNRVRIVGFLQNTGEGLPYYAEQVEMMYMDRGWSRGGAMDFVPHDAKVTEWGSKKTRIEQMLEKGLNPVLATEASLADGINAVRTVLPHCEFDHASCAEGLAMLKGYRKEWNDDRGCWADRPRHDKHSHGSDAFRYLALSHRDLAPPPAPAKPKITTRQPTLEEVLAEHERDRKFLGRRI